MKWTLRASLSLALALQSVPTSVLACTEPGGPGFMPDNKMRISQFTADNVSDISEAKFKSILKRVEDFYFPIAKEKGGNLSIFGEWKSATVNAYAVRSGTTWIVNIFGGLARHPQMTEDGLMLVVCHELGHHLGGAPKKPRSISNLTRWASNEGQADYWGTMKCLRRILQPEDNVAFMATKTISSFAQAKCDETYRDDQERALCARIANASESLARVLAQPTEKISFETPDTSVVKKTFDDHPKAQCRLDTYFQGNLCPRNVLDQVSDSDPARGVCTLADKSTQGIRPLCWNKPSKNEL